MVPCCKVSTVCSDNVSCYYGSFTCQRFSRTRNFITEDSCDKALATPLSLLVILLCTFIEDKTLLFNFYSFSALKCHLSFYDITIPIATPVALA